jgi:hypothetical protein
MDEQVTSQRRNRKLAMTDADLANFLDTERVCRFATVDVAGRPHVAPLWFVWLDPEPSLWLYSIITSQRWHDLGSNPVASAVIDSGDSYFDLRGVEILGTVEIVGEVPRTGTSDVRLEEPERRFGAKYSGSTMHHDERHAWLRLRPEKVISWDFRKLRPA